MPSVRTAVLLFAFPFGQQLQLKGDVHWYRNYFFGVAHGQAGYWLRQSNNDVLFLGEVFDWAVVDGSGPNLMNRYETINAAIKALEKDRGLNFDRFDTIVLVLGVPANVNTDSGSTTARSKDRSHAGVIVRVGESFDFVAHELGHAIGLHHSYGPSTYQNASWSQPGEYAHPYCVMSARGYGGVGGPFFPPKPRDGRPEYSGLGPSLNAGTAVARGWLKPHVHSLPGGQKDYELRSRHWLGDFPGATPQALEVRAGDGKTYVLEYRVNAGWDAGQGAPVFIVNAVEGSTADLAHPNTDSATFLGQIRLPITFGAPGSIYNGPGFGVEVLGRSTATNTLRIRLRDGRSDLTPIELKSSKRTLATATVETGTTTFERGEKLCVDGIWPYEKIERREVASFEATYALAAPPLSVTWTVDGIELAGNGGDFTLLNKAVNVANPKLDPQPDSYSVMLTYEIEAVANGSRLRLSNLPVHETFDIAVSAVLTTSVGSGSEVGWVRFNGREYRYPRRFYDEREACLGRFIDIGERYVPYKVLLEPDLWQRLPETIVSQVEQVLYAMAYAHERGEVLAYRELTAHLADLTGTTSLSPLIVSEEEPLNFTPQVVEKEPRSRESMIAPFRGNLHDAALHEASDS
jgi:hypothetical protein